MTHQDRVEAVLKTAVRECTKWHTAAAGSLIRQRVESCLSTALAICKEDKTEMYKRIDVERQHDE